MKTLYLIRHAEKDIADNQQLSEQGRKQAIETTEKLVRPAKLYAAEQTSALQMAQIICDKWHVRPEPLACLNQLAYEPTPEEPLLAPPMMMGMPAAFQIPPEPKEKPLFTFENLNSGVDTFLKIAPKFPHRTTCVVHEKWLHLLLWRVLGFRADTPQEEVAFHKWQAITPSPEAWYLHIGDSWETWLQVIDFSNQK